MNSYLNVLQKVVYKDKKVCALGTFIF